jgi:putative acetyltransferase
MKTTNIRLIRKEDNEIIASIIRSVLTEFKANRPGTVYYDPTTDDLFTLFTRSGSEYWIFELDGKIVGGSGVYPTEGLPEGCCELVKLYLLPEARGKGYGQQLIEQCFTSAGRYGFKQVYLETMPELKMAMGLYEKCGFKYLTGPMGNSGHFGCDLWMLKTL